MLKLGIKNLDHYRRALLATLPIFILVLLYLLINGLVFHATDFLLPEWFLNFFVIPAFVSNSISGSTYIARIIDAYHALSGKQSIGFSERTGTSLGVFLGIAAGVTLLILHITIPCTASLSYVADGFFLLNSISTFGGLGNRIGNCADKNSKPKGEKWAIGVGTLVGLAVSITLVVLAASALVSIAGITTFLTAGAALPFWISSPIFMVSFVSTCASSADYSSKAATFIKSHNTTDRALKKTVNDKFHEYRGSCVGVAIGLMLGSAIVVTLFVTMPYIFVGVAGLVAAAMVVSTCVSMLGGLFSRSGRLIDGLKKTPARKSPENSPNDPHKEFTTSAKIMNVLKTVPKKLTHSQSYASLPINKEKVKNIDCYHGFQQVLLAQPVRTLMRSQSMNDLYQPNCGKILDPKNRCCA